MFEPLGKLIRLEYGQALPSKQRTGYGYPVFGSNGVVGHHEHPLITGPGIVIGRKGSVGKVAWSETSFWPIDTTYYVESQGCEISWAYRVLDWLPLQDLDTSTGVPGLNRNDVYEVSVFVPCKKEQAVIARALDTLDTQIQKTEALIAKLEKVKEGLLHDLLTRGIDENGLLRPSPEQAPELYKESPLGLIPREWALVNLGDCITSMDQGWSPTCEDVPSADDEWGVLKTSSVTWEGYAASENKKLPENLSPLPKYEVFEDDVLITRAGPKSRVGVVCYVYGTPPNIMISDKLYRLRFSQDCVQEFFSLQLSHRSVQSQISRTVSGMADSQTNISQHTINSLIVCLPQKYEQEAICNSIRSISLWVGKEKCSLVELRKLKAGLMDDLLTGRVRVTPLLEQAQATTPA